MTTKNAKDLLPYLFENRAVPTQHDPANAISEVACPACQAKRKWRIVATRTLKTTGDIKRNTVCLACGYTGAFIERTVAGVPKIVLAPDPNEQELLHQIEVLTGEIEEATPRLRVLDEIWELVEPGRRDTPIDDLVDKIRARVGGGEVGPDDDTWAPVRIALGGALDDKVAASPQAIADAIDQVRTSLNTALERSQQDAKGYYEDKVALVRHLEAAGAKKVGEGWAWPFYDADGKEEFLPPTEWVKRRKEAAVEIARLKDAADKGDEGRAMGTAYEEAQARVKELEAQVEELTAKAVTDKLPAKKKSSSKSGSKKKSAGKKKTATATK